MDMVKAAVLSWVLAGIIGFIAYGGAASVAAVVVNELRDRADQRSQMTVHAVRQRVGDALLLPATGTYVLVFIGWTFLTHCHTGPYGDEDCGGPGSWAVIAAFVALLAVGLGLGGWLLENLVLAQKYGYGRRFFMWWAVWIVVYVLADWPVALLPSLAGISGCAALAALCARIPTSRALSRV